MSPLVTASCSQSSGRGSLFRQRTQREVYNRVIFAEEGSELDYVGNEVVAEDDVAYEGAVVIYQFTIQEKNISGLLRADFDTFL